MKELLKSCENTFYTDVASFLVAVIGLIISIWKRKSNPKLKFLSFFFLCYVLDQLVYFLDIVIIARYPQMDPIRCYTDFADTIVEFLVFFFLIKNHIDNIRIRKVLNPLLPVFLSSIFIYLVYYKTTHKEINQYFLQMIFTIQASLLIIACILYYLDLFKKEMKLNLLAQPSFWVVTGLSLFMLSTLPFSFIGLHLFKLNFILYFHLFNIFNIFYCLLFIMIIRAYLCKPITA
jgi:hypothetical protein